MGLECGWWRLEITIFLANQMSRTVSNDSDAVQIACGGHHTLGVARHDAEREDTEERRRGYKGKMRAWFGTGGPGHPALDVAATR